LVLPDIAIAHRDRRTSKPIEAKRKSHSTGRSEPASPFWDKAGRKNKILFPADFFF